MMAVLSAGAILSARAEILADMIAGDQSPSEGSDVSRRDCKSIYVQDCPE